MKRWIVLCLLMVPLLASAESYWDGSAALQRGDAAFEGGLYAASNSFPPDTVLLIQNLDSGRSTTATVSETVDGQSDILIFLSPRAADAIGVTAGSIARVRVVVLQKAPAATSSAAPEIAFNPDQDANPGAAFARTGNPAEQSAARQTGTQVASQPAATQEQPTQQPASQQATPPQAVTQQPASQAPLSTTQQQVTQAAPQTAPLPAAQSQETADNARIIAEAGARRPQKQLFLPPREDQRFAYKPPSPEEQTVASRTPHAPQPTATSTPEAPPEIPSVTGETTVPAQQKAEVPLAEARPESGATPQEAAGSTPQPGEQAAGAELALPEARQEGTASEQPSIQARPGGNEGEKVALQPPETPPQQAAPQQATPQQPAPQQATPQQPAPQQVTPPLTATSTTRATGVQVVASLPKLAGKKNAATFYVQLGVYATQEGAQDIAVRFVETYPMIVLTPPSGEKQTYKVLVGPLNKAESGTLLPLFRFRGFRDAFVRRE